MKILFFIILSVSLLKAEVKFNDILYTMSLENETKLYIEKLPKDGLSCKFMTNLYYISPIIVAALKEHFNNPHDIPEEVLKDFMATDTFSKRIGFFALSDINFRVSNALHEAGHLVLYREITNLNYGYSKKILNSLSAEIKIIGNSSARVHSYEPNILFTKQEILLRMKMLIAGQIASKIF